MMPGTVAWSTIVLKSYLALCGFFFSILSGQRRYTIFQASSHPKGIVLTLFLELTLSVTSRYCSRIAASVLDGVAFL